ncbi:alpha-amylase-related protein-like [Copidosoma floridanum]|uniref:alpha-amylase-related protein-like n=1 Tax=Copidosoma floridanum TaxID=29053 RepID=UPI0006C9E3CE|nr:alpha-amylase-related protein-like [Copidosoma floridanum]
MSGRASMAVVPLLVLLVSAGGAQKVPNYAANRTTMVHLFEWKWNDIANECENFLGPKGFAGVQVSPVQENVIIKGRPWYERYQPISYLMETRSGTEAEFRGMVERCNRVGVRIYVDVLLNHMSADHEDATGTAGSPARPHERHYPAVPYSREHFHDTCSINDYGNVHEVRNCELVGLHDLDQRHPHVRAKQLEFLNRVIGAGVAGFRVDAAKHMWPNDLKYIYSSTRELNTSHSFPENGRAFFFQEVIDYGGEGIKNHEYSDLGVVTEFRYGHELSNAMIGNNQLKWLVSWGQDWGFMPPGDALVFIDNHDTQRSGNEIPLTYQRSRLYKMSVAFMLAHPYGWPRIMSSFDLSGPLSPPTTSPNIRPDGSCSGPWICEHRWRQIYNMVGFRNRVANADLNSWWDNGSNQISFCRGDRGFLAINGEKDAVLSQRLKVCVAKGTYCDVISGELRDGRCTGKSIKVDENGTAHIQIRPRDEDGVVAIHVGENDDVVSNNLIHAFVVL